jgi:hypothetical protein
MGLVSEKYGQILEWDTEEQTVPSISELNRLSLLYKTKEVLPMNFFESLVET